MTELKTGPSRSFAFSAERRLARARKPRQRKRDSVKLAREVRASGLKLHATAVSEEGGGVNRQWRKDDDEAGSNQGLIANMLKVV